MSEPFIRDPDDSGTMIPSPELAPGAIEPQISAIQDDVFVKANESRGIIPVRDPSGRIGNVSNDPNSLQLASQDGWTPATRREVELWDASGEELNVVRDGVVGIVPKAKIDEAIGEGWKVATREEIDAWDREHPIVFMKTGDGRVEAVQRANMKTREGEGWTRATDDEVNEEFNDVGSVVATGLEGFFQGVTAHGYSLGAKLLAGDEYIAAMEKRKELSPVVSTTSEIGGILTTAVGTGGLPIANAIRAAGAARAAGQVGGRAVATRIGSRILADTIEGVGWSAVSRVADGLTGDDGLDVEKIILGVGEDGLLSAGFGAGFGVGGEVASLGKRAIERLLKGKTAFEAVDDVAAHLRFKEALGGSNKPAARKAVKEWNDPNADVLLGRWINEKGIEIPTNPAERAELFEELAQSYSDELDRLVGVLDTRGVRPDSGRIGDVIRGHIADLRANPGTERLADEIERSLRPVIRELDRSFTGTGPTGKYDSFGSIQRLRRDIDGMVNWNTESKVKNESLKQLRWSIEREFESMADELIGDETWSASWRSTKNDWRAANFFKKVSTDAVAGSVGNNATGLRATLLGAAGGSVIGDAIAEAGTSLLSGLGGGVVGSLALSYGLSKAAPYVPAAKRAAAEGLRDLLVKGGTESGKTFERGIRALETTLARSSHPLREREPVMGRAIDEKTRVALVDTSSQLVAGDGPVNDAYEDMFDEIAERHGTRFARLVEGAIRSRAAIAAAVANDRRSNSDLIGVITDPGRAFERIARGEATRREADLATKLYPQHFARLKRRAEIGLREGRVPRDIARKISRTFSIPDRRIAGLKPLFEGPPADPMSSDIEGTGRPRQTRRNVDVSPTSPSDTRFKH